MSFGKVDKNLIISNEKQERFIMYNMYNNQKRRKYKRIEKQYMARFQIRPDKTKGIGFYDWNSFILKNVSAEGAFFFTIKN